MSPPNTLYFRIPSDFLYDPVSATGQLYHNLVKQGVQGLRLPSEREITAFIDPNSTAQAQRQSGLRIMYCSDYQRELAAMMQGEMVPNRELTVKASVRILREPIPVPRP